MKRLLFFSVLLALLVPFQANAEYLKCELDLNVIEDTDSSEHKQLVFDFDLNHGSKNMMSGSMITHSCFNSFVDPFVSESSEFKKVMINNLIHGVISSPQLAIGKYNYQLGLNISQLAAADEDGVISFKADGKLRPLDNENYIHQNIEGECYLSEKPLFSWSMGNMKSMPMERCNENNGLK